MKQMHAEEARPTEINVVRKNAKAQKNAFEPKKGNRERNKTACYRYGKGHKPDRCGYRDAKCRACSRIRNLQVMCQEKRNKKARTINYVDSSDKDSDEAALYHIVLCANDEKRGYRVSVHIEGKPVSMFLDTHAAVTSMPESIFMKVCSHVKFKPTTASLKTYTEGP